MLKLLSKINAETVNYFALLLLAFSISFPQRIVIYTVAFWILTCLPILKFKGISVARDILSAPLLILSFLFLGRTILSIYHCDFPDFVMKQLLDTQLALVVLPCVLIFQVNKRIHIDRVILIYIVGCFISSVLAVICFYLFRFGILDPWSHLLFIPLRTIHSTFADDVILFQDYISAFFKHRAAVGANLVMAIACLIYLLKKTRELEPLRLVEACFVVAFFVCIVYVTGSRSGLISLFSVLILTVIYLLFNKRKRLVFGFLLIGTLLSGCMSMKTTRTLLTSEVSSLDYSKIRTADPRFKIWESVIEIIKENPIVGVGYSRVNSQLFEKYKTKGLTQYYKERFKTHNQFLQFSLESGVWAGVLYAVFLLPIYFGRENRYLSFAFSATFFFYSMFEDSLILINGVSLLAFFIAILYLSDKKRNELSE